MSENTISVGEELELHLNKLLRGNSPVLEKATCTFSYQHNFEEKKETASSLKIKDCETDILLHPIGIRDHLMFMSEIPPTTFIVDGESIVVFRIILSVDLASKKPSAAIMFNEDGSVIQTTENFGTLKESFAGL